MTLLEVIKNVSINPKPTDSPPDYPVVLNPDDILPNLRPESEELCPSSLVKPLSGWKISPTNAEIIDLSKSSYTDPKTNVESTNDFIRTS